MRLNRSLFQSKLNQKKIESKTDEATVYLYDEIGYFGITAAAFVRDLSEIKAKTINLRINSPGGSVFEGTTIFNAVRQHSSKVVVHIDGLAASIASIIALAGDEVRMAKNAFIMIHEPWSMIMGSANELRKEADLLDKVCGTIAQSYVDKTGKAEDEIKKYMEEETWFTADEALESGFIDSIYEQKDTKNLSLFDLSAFARVPAALLGDGEDKDINERDLERVLRDAGLSRKQAKAIISDGLVQRDADPSPPDPALRDVVAVVKVKRSVEELLSLAEIMAPITK